MPQRTEYEIAQDDQEMLNALLLADDILRDFPIRSPRMTAFLEAVQAILDRKRQRFLQHREEERITHLNQPCESLTGA